MDSNITFRIDSDVKQQMAAICNELGMTPSTAFNLFAKAFVRMKGMPFPITIQEPSAPQSVSAEKMMEDADKLLEAFSEDYARMAK